MGGGGGGGPPGGMSDIFDILSGGSGRGGGRQRERRGENVVHRLKVSLEEVYNGGTRSGPAHTSSCSLQRPFVSLLHLTLPCSGGASFADAALPQ